MPPSYTQQKILIVDDRPENLVALEAILEGPGRDILMARSGNEALEMLLEHEIALVILDVQMPGMDGFETATLMRRVERCRHIPIIFVTAINTEEANVFKGYESGAVDYILKPLEPVILQAKARVFLELDRQRRELEEKTIALERTIARQEEYKRLIEEQNRALKELAIRDGLTGIYNHRHFQELLAREVALAKRYGHDLGCLMMDLDHFKEVNDVHGHQFGDFVLKEFVRLVQQEIRSSDIFARYGGEEFVLLLPSISRDGVRKVAEKIRATVETHQFRLHAHERRVTVTIGIFHGRPERDFSEADLLRYADKALYQAKAKGRNRVLLYTPDPTISLWEDR